MPQWFLRFSEFPEFSESFASFRENSIEVKSVKLEYEAIDSGK